MIRLILPADTPRLLALTRDTGVFRPLEIQALAEVLHDYHAANHQQGHRAVGFEQQGQLAGFVYYAPAAMTQGTWYLWWIAVARDCQSAGIGGQLLQHAEEDICREHGRHLLIETSSLPHYQPTHRFYRKHGYEQLAVLPDYYAVGDDMIVYRKVFGPPER